jgi:hypothetical protein
VRTLGIYAIASAALIAGAGWLLTFAFPTASDRHAMIVSAVVGYAVQLLAFAIARAWAANVVAGWGMGMLIRFIVLAIYAFLSSRVLGLPVAAALVSLAAFFFVSTLLEPVLLKS